MRRLLALVLCACHTTEISSSPSSSPSRSPSPSRSSSSSPSSSPSPSPSPSTSTSTSTSTPSALSCLAKHYVGEPEREGSSWFLRLPGGARLYYDDGLEKSAAQRLDTPDLQDIFAQRYPSGPPGPVTEVDFDPGRVRVERLMRATYGETPADVSAALVDVVIRNHHVRVHHKIAEPFRRVAARLDKIVGLDPSLDRFFRQMGGTFNPRRIAGTERTSAHAWGIAIDLDPSLSEYWRNDPKLVWKNRMAPEIVAVFEAEGFAWGGRWFHYDTMHFEYRPELFDPSCWRD